MRSTDRRREILCKKVRNLELDNEALRAEANQSHNLAQCISTREGNQTYRQHVVKQYIHVLSIRCL